MEFTEAPKGLAMLMSDVYSVELQVVPTTLVGH